MHSFALHIASGNLGAIWRVKRGGVRFPHAVHAGSRAKTGNKFFLSPGYPSPITIPGGRPTREFRIASLGTPAADPRAGRRVFDGECRDHFLKNFSNFRSSFSGTFVSHSQITSTFQPPRRNFATFRLSRSTLLASLGSQYLPFDFGRRPSKQFCFECWCQKQP